jgi:hypothetical protein
MYRDAGGNAVTYFGAVDEASAFAVRLQLSVGPAVAIDVLAKSALPSMGSAVRVRRRRAMSLPFEEDDCNCTLNGDASSVSVGSLARENEDAAHKKNCFSP